MSGVVTLGADTWSDAKSRLRCSLFGISGLIDVLMYRSVYWWYYNDDVDL
jgi:hypothetical protein